MLNDNDNLEEQSLELLEPGLADEVAVEDDGFDDDEYANDPDYDFFGF